MTHVADQSPHAGVGDGDGGPQAPGLTAQLAQQLIAIGVAESRRRGVRLAFAVADIGGNTVAVLRDDDAQLGALSLATDKAFTAVSFGMPTSAWTESSRPGQGDWGLAGTLGGRAIVFPGGIPLSVDGVLVGALGVSGTSSLIDEEIAIHAATELGLGTAS